MTECVYKYALSIIALEIRGGELYSRLAYSTYAEGANKFESKASTLSLNITTPIPINEIMVWTAVKDKVEIFYESENRLLREEKELETLNFKASVEVFGKVFQPETQYLVPPACDPLDVYTETKCIHDRCGPSWGHYACNHRCLVRSCCATTGHCGDWTPLRGGTCGWDCF